MRTTLLSLVRGWRAALWLVLVTCATPDRASATCGEHVVIRHSSSELKPAAISDESQPAAPARLPCHGPNCSGSPAGKFPPLAPVISIGTTVKEYAQSLIVMDDAAASHSPLVQDNTSPRPIRRASSVFHPPRRG